MIAIACHCGRHLQTEDAYAGRQVRCPFCGLVLQVPGEPARQTQAVQQTIETPRRPEVPHEVSTTRKLLQPGQKFSHYTVRRRLGAGAMGEVWLAFDPALERELAIKILPPALGADEERLLRFFREARLAARLNHPHAVTIYQVGVDEGLPFLAMEYVDGGSLEEIVHQSGPIGWRRATQIIRDAAAGLAQAHALGLVHRDIKPANLLCTSTGVTKVADFGLARTNADEGSLTREGASLGTPAYMAPEQWKGQPADARSDQYSLVCTYFFLLTGRPPFVAPSVPALGYQHTHEPFPAVSGFVHDLPAGISRILERASQKAPEHRFQTVGELIAALDSQFVHQPIPAAAVPDVPIIVTPSPVQHARTPVSRRSLRRQTGIQRACAAATVLLGLLVIYFLVVRLNSPTNVAPSGTAPASATAGQLPLIPSDADIFAGDAYKFFPEQLPWHEAKAKCAALGGRLVVIDHASENQFLGELVTRAGRQDAWIGITDEAKEGDWRTVDGEPVNYTNWFSGQPNNKKGNEHFALMSNRSLPQPLGWSWSDQPNESLQHQPGYICEWENPRPAVTATGTRLVQATATPIPLTDWQEVHMTGDTSVLGTGGWSLESELIACVTTVPGYLKTRRSYNDFILELDYRLVASGNSGILVRAQDNGQAKPECMEIQLLAESQFVPPESRNGAIHGVVAPRSTPTWRAGEWNKLKIHCEREKVAVWVNDIEVVDVQMFRVPQLQNRPRSGFIALYNWQGRANGTQFRNIRITELK